MRELTPLCLLARKHQTDKGGRHQMYGGQYSDTCHEYTPVYWDLLNARREDVKHVLEIGINSGASLRMWEEFFPNAQIIGFDCEPGTFVNEGRISSYYAHQSSKDSLLAAMAQVDGPLFDLIIDDGSHKMTDQVVTMQTLLPFLSNNGYYVIEDMDYDCMPDLLGLQVPAVMLDREFEWRGIQCDMGIGKARCGCGCNQPESLLVVRPKDVLETTP